MEARGTVIVSSITGIGSTILVTPMLKALRRARPDSRIVLLVRFDPARDLLAGGGLVDEIRVCDYKTLSTARSRVGFVRWLRQLQAGAFINAFPGNRRDKHVLARLSGASARIGHRYEFGYRRNLGFLINRPVPIRHETHDTEQNLSLLGPLQIASPESPELPEIWISESDAAEAAERLRSLGRGPFIGVHPGSSVEQGMHYKRWNPARFAEVGRKLAKLTGARVLVFGGEDETQLKRKVADEIGTSAVVVTETITLTAALIGHTQAFLSSDSGLMHIAAAAGIPTVAVFGPTDHHRTAPMGACTALIRAGLDCSPCWRLETLGKPFHCVRGGPECMEAVTVDQVVDRILSLAGSRLYAHASP